MTQPQDKPAPPREPELKTAAARREAKPKPAADRELTDAELDRVAAAGSDSNRSNL